MARFSAISLVVFSFTGFAAAQKSDELQQDRFPCQGIVNLITDNGELKINVEIAVSDQEHARGLMERGSLPESSGMLFIFTDLEERAFWMKNTPLPLDILFFGEGGRLVKAHEDAVPFDLTPLPSPPAFAVLEVEGGKYESSFYKGAELQFDLNSDAICPISLSKHPLYVNK